MAAPQQEASLEDLIAGYAKDNGIPEALALAVARKESGVNPGAVGDGGKAIGMFQLHPGAATDTGIPDRSDPVQNAYGGVKYLKQLSDHYNGDVEKILHAYNGGMGNVDKGTVSPAAQAYAADVMASLTGAPAAASRTDIPNKPVTSHAPTNQSYLQQKDAQYGQPVAPPHKKPSLGKQLLEPFDPKTTSGRINLAGLTAGSVATIMTGGLGAEGFLPWIARVLGPPTAAALAGGGTAEVERRMGTAPPNTDAVREGLIQGGMELGGQAAGWVLRRGAREVLASRVGTNAKAAFEELATAHKAAATKALERARSTRDALVTAAQRRAESAGDAANRAVTAARGVRDSLVTAAQRRKGDALAVAHEGATSAVREAEGLSTRLTDATRRKFADDLADTELRNAAELADASAHYERVLAEPPSPVQTGQAAKEVVTGAPGIPAPKGQPKGPAIRALDAAGQKVRQTAAEGPDIKLQGFKDELNRMGFEARPAEVFGEKEGEAARAITTARGQSLLPSASANPADRAAFEQRLAKYGADVRMGAAQPNMPSLLGILQDAPPTVKFSTGHAIKELLDEAVNWDQVAKKHLEKITKGIRGTLRETMSDYEPYNQATTLYAELVPLYRKGIGRDLIKTIVNGKPDKIAKLLDEQSPASAKSLHELLVTQSAAGGDAAAGRKAWDAVVNSYLYDNVAKGGAEGLSERVHSLITQNPDFAKVAFQYPEARQVLSNLQRIGTAYELAVKQGAERVSGVKAATQAGVQRAEQIGQAGVEETRDVGQAALTQARQHGAEGVAAARRSGGEAIAAAQESAAKTRRAGTEDVRTERRAGDETILATKAGNRETAAEIAAKQKRLRDSTISPDALKSDAVNAIRTTMGRNAFQAIGLLRLLSGAKSADIIEFAAHSGPVTRLMVDALLGNETDRGFAALMRAIGGQMLPQQPVTSHQPAQSAPR